MEKGHFGGYTGNARHSRKEEMIHDRELISDAKKQLHHADQDYKHDSPAHRALVGDQNKLPGHLKKAISDAPAQMNADLAYDPINDRADSPMMNLNKGYSPLKGVFGSAPGSVNSRIGSGDISKASGGIGTFKENYPDNTFTNQVQSNLALGDISKAAGRAGTFKENYPDKPSSTSPSPSTTSGKSSSYTTVGQNRREKRLGKAERKADLKKSQGKIVATNRLEKKASRIKNRAYVKGDSGSSNQYDTKTESPMSMYGKKESPAAMYGKKVGTLAEQNFNSEKRMGGFAEDVTSNKARFSKGATVSASKLKADPTIRRKKESPAKNMKNVLSGKQRY